jgi:chromosome transmission fidelity protein 18
MYRAIDVFVHYDGKRAGDILASRFAVRQLVAQAVSWGGALKRELMEQVDAEIARRKGEAGAASGGTDNAASLAGMYGMTK